MTLDRFSHKSRAAACLAATLVASLAIRAAAFDPPTPPEVGDADVSEKSPPAPPSAPVAADQGTVESGGFDPRGGGGDPELPILDPNSSRISYQALLTDNAGNALPGPNVALAFRIYTTGGALVEGPILMAVVPITNGMVDVQVPVSRTSFDGTGRTLGVTVNPPSAELAPRIPLTAVPYAFRVDRVASPELDDSIDLGTAADAGLLNVFRTAAGTPGITLAGASSAISTFGSDGLEQIRLHGSTWGEILLHDRVDNDITAMLSATNEAGGLLSLRDANGLEVLSARGSANSVVDATGSFNVFSSLAAGTRFGSLERHSGGAWLTTFDEAGVRTAYVGSSGVAGGFCELMRAGTATVGLRLDGDDGNSGLVSMRNSANAVTATLDGDAGDAGALFTMSNGTVNTVIIDANTNGAGAIDVREDDGSVIFAMRGSDTAGSGGELQAFNSAGGLVFDIDTGSTVPSMNLLDGSGSTITNAINFSTSTTSGGVITLRNATGTGTIILDGDFGATGDGRITTNELQITGGSDLSEQFDILPAAGEAAPTPGQVVCIDAKRPGELAVSSRAYDRTVAGIISGAGGVRTGMMMGQVGTKADGKHAVALTGRVYVWCDASTSAIEPGDLLTSSAVAGHAMKAVDHDRSQGAIIGKAMTPLAQGRGLVLVLVTLQ